MTDQFLDASVRQNNLESVIAKLTELLAQATTVDDSLKVHRELTRFTEQLELQKGRVKYLTQTTASSSLTVS